MRFLSIVYEWAVLFTDFSIVEWVGAHFYDFLKYHLFGCESQFLEFQFILLLVLIEFKQCVLCSIEFIGN